MSNRKRTFLRKALHFILKALFVFALVFCILVIYAGLKARSSKERVEAFCREVRIGMPVSGLEENAKELGLHYRRTGDSSNVNGRVTAWDGFAYSRWFCEVEYQGEKAVKKSVTFLD